MDAAFWRGRRVLVTGHTGFKGAWLCVWLQRLGAQVTGYALDPVAPCAFEIAGVAAGMSDVRGDVRDLDAVRAAVEGAHPEVIIHMAAQSLVRRSYDDPLGTYAVNVMGTAHVLEASRAAAGLRAIVVVTSDKCYRDDGTGASHRESDPLGGADPYSSSKACAELVTDAYRRSFFGDRVALATARAGNVIGGGDWADDRLVPDAIRAFTTGRALEVRSPSATRPWQHVLEPLSGYLALAERLCSPAGRDFAGAWNFGPAASHAVGDVASRLAALWGDGARWEAAGGTHRPEAAALVLDSSRARERLGWSPRTTLEDALAWSVEWYRAWRGRADMRHATEAQIARFSSRGA